MNRAGTPAHILGRMSRRLIFRLRQWTRGMSTWLIPLVGAITGMALVPLVDWLDDQVVLPVPLRYSEATAIEVLSVVIIAEAVLIGFAVTMAALGAQKATGAFAAGITPPWYPDLHFKVLLAVLVGTLTFSFWGIGHVVEGDVPHVAVSAAGIGLAVGLVLLVVNLDRVLRLTQPISVAAMMAREARRAFESELLDAARPDTAFVPMGPQRSRDPAHLRAPREARRHAAGHGPARVRRVRRAIRLCRRVPAIGRRVRVRRRSDPRDPGCDATRCRVRAAARPDRDRRRPDGGAGSGVRDPDHGRHRHARPLGRRKDPTTAVQVIDHLGSTLRLIGSAPARLAGPRSVTMEAGVIVPVPDWPDTLALATTEIREYAADSVQVTRRLRALFDDLAETVRPENRAAVAGRAPPARDAGRGDVRHERRPRSSPGRGPAGPRRTRRSAAWAGRGGRRRDRREPHWRRPCGNARGPQPAAPVATRRAAATSSGRASRRQAKAGPAVGRAGR